MSVEGAKQWLQMANERIAQEPLVALAAALSGLLEVAIDEQEPTLAEETRPPPDWLSRCPTSGCYGDARYAAPGRGHIEGCLYPHNVLDT